METIRCPDRYFLRSIAFIGLEVKENRNFLHAEFFKKLYVDQVGLLAIGLPKGCHLVVSQLLNSISVFCTGQCPHCQVSNLSSL